MQLHFPFHIVYPYFFVTDYKLLTASPHVYRISPRVHRPSPHVYGISPHVYRASSHVYRISPRVHIASPHVYRITPRVHRASPRDYRISPRAQRALHVYRLSPRVHRASPHVYRHWQNIRCELLWNFMQRRIVLLYWRFGIIYRSHLQRSSSFWTVWPLKMVRLGYAETSLWNYHSTLRKIQKVYRSLLCLGGSLKSRNDRASSIHLHTVWCYLRRYSVIKYFI